MEHSLFNSLLQPPNSLQYIPTIENNLNNEMMVSNKQQIISCKYLEK